MRIPLEFYDHLRQRISISQTISHHVQLSKKNYEYSGICPFHDEKTPSFTVNDAKKFYHCFGCGAHGDVIKFIAERNGINYQAAAIKLAELHNIDIPKLNSHEAAVYDEIDEIQRINELAKDFFIEQLHLREYNHIVNYLNKRGITTAQIKRFEIGYATGNNALQHHLEKHKIPLMHMQKAGLMGKRENGNFYEIFRERIIFPIKNIFNKTIAFGARAIGDVQPKYLNSPETLIFKKSETLYGEDKATSLAYKKNQMILVEGYVDVIAMQSNGFDYTVASLGTAVTISHLNKIWHTVDEAILCLDGDSAGLKATTKAIDVALPFIQGKKTLSFIFLPTGLDPDELIKTKGAVFTAELITQRLPLSEAIWHIETDGKIFRSAEQYALLEGRLTNYTKLIKDPIINRNIHLFFKEQLWQLRKTKSKISQQKPPIKSVNITIPDSQISEIEHLEYAIFSCLVRFPQTLLNEHNMELLSNFDVQHEILCEFYHFLLENIENFNNNTEKFNCLLKNSRFFELYNLLLQANSIFLDTQSLNNMYTPITIWNIILKRYNLAVMKKEYILLLNTFDQKLFSKAQIYKKEIENIHLELEKYILDHS